MTISEKAGGTLADNRRRILFINHKSRRSGITGAEKSLIYVVQAAAATRDLEPFVITPGKGKSTKRLLELGVPVYVVRALSYRRVKKVLKKVKPHLVCVNTIHPVGTGAAKAIRRYRVLWFVRDLPKKPRKRAERFSFVVRHSRGVVAVSRAVLRELERFGGRRKCHLLYNAVDLEAQRPKRWPAVRAEARRFLGIPEDAWVVAYLGKITRPKGVGDFLKMAHRLRRRKDIRFVLVGASDTDNARPLVKMAKQLFSKVRGPRPIFTGFYDDVEDILPAVDVVVAPSLNPEPCARAILEAMAYGKPVVAYDSGGSAELVRHGATGFVVRKGDIRGLARAVLKILDPECYRAMSEAARERVRRHFNMADYRRQVVDLLRRYAGK